MATRVIPYEDIEKQNYYMQCVRDMNLGKAEQKIRGFVNLIQVFRSGLDSYPIPDLIQAVIERTGYDEYIRNESDDEQEAEAYLRGWLLGL